MLAILVAHRLVDGRERRRPPDAGPSGILEQGVERPLHRAEGEQRVRLLLFERLGYGGRRLEVDRARRLKELEQENAKLKRLVSELSLEKLVLKDIASGNF